MGEPKRLSVADAIKLARETGESQPFHSPSGELRGWICVPKEPLPDDPEVASLRTALSAALSRAAEAEKERDEAVAAYENLRFVADKLTRTVARARKAHDEHGTAGRWPKKVAEAEANLTDACGEVFVAIASPSAFVADRERRIATATRASIVAWLRKEAEAPLTCGPYVDAFHYAADALEEDGS